jgi:hypothetical protein
MATPSERLRAAYRERRKLVDEYNAKRKASHPVSFDVWVRRDWKPRLKAAAALIRPADVASVNAAVTDPHGPLPSESIKAAAYAEVSP